MLRVLQRFFRTGLVTVVLATLLGNPVVALAQASQTGAPINLPATGAGFPVVLIGGDMHRLAENAYGSVWTSITRAVMVAFFNAAQLFLGQLAYDAANAIATAGTGQQPIYYRKGFDNYMKDVAADAAGDFVGSLSESHFFRTVGFNLCQPSTGNIGMLRIQMSLSNFFPGLQSKFERPRPKCEPQQFVRNWGTYVTTMSQQDVFKNIDFSFNPNANDIGISSSIFNLNAASIKAKLDAAVLQRTEGRGIKAITNIITGDVKTPADVVRESTNEATVRQPNQTQSQMIGAIMTTGMQQGGLQLLQYTASMFVNTLASKLLRRVFESGVGGGIDLPRSVGTPDLISTTGKTDARNANIDLRTPNLFKVATFDAMADFVACPENTRGTWNCVMDQSLAQSLQRQGEQGAFTIREALARNYLHGDWRLIPGTKVRENTDPLCHTYAYCAGNLAKLRLLRVLPVGVEFAANSPENVALCASASGCATLKQVVDGFNDCENGERTANKKWCHLVDPNWVITLPQQICSIKGYGDTLLTPQIGQRKEECSDIKTCLQRNDKGECVGGYGYCVAEKTVYRFGADECPAQYNSCRQYKSRAGVNIGYLRNTLDYAQCSAENAGCLWYATERVANTPGAWVGTTTTGPRVYFDKTMETCSAQDDGCTRLLAVNAGEPALNLVPNSSFEQITTDTPGRLSDWRWSVGGVEATRPYREPTVTAGTAFAQGAKALELTVETDAAYQTLRLAPERIYTLSAFVRAKNAARTARLGITLNEYDDLAGTRTYRRDDGGPMGRLYRSTGCSVSPADRTARISVVNGAGEVDEWSRVNCSFLTTSSTVSGSISLIGRDILVDGVELEESEYMTEYVESVSNDATVVHMKLPPEELRCTGGTTDPGLCGNFAKMCRQADAGCDQFTDTVASEQVNAVATTNDLCPNSCVGYAEYRKMPSSFDLVQDLDARFDDVEDASSTFMIPQRGQLCRADEVGCEEFTNVEGAAAGGEQKSYFSYTRSCRKPGPDSSTFFTWEGSDVTGYQLRSFGLVRADAGPAPKIVIKRQPGDLYYKEPSECNAGTWARQEDADCRQFYDADGNTYYRFLSQTVLATEKCQTFRLTITNRADCEKTDGQYNAGANECLYQVFAPESRTCRAAAAGCRAYAGARSGNAQSLLSQTFRNATGTFVGGRLSNESLVFGDSSLRVDVAAGRDGEASVPVLNTNEGELYQVTFYAKSVNPATLEVRAVNRDGGSENNLISSVTLTADWQRFTMGPFKGILGEATTTVAFKVLSRPAAQVFFVDEVNVIKLEDVAYVLEDSWTVPAECNRTASGAELPQAMLGCREYKNRQNQDVNLKSFSRLCRASAVGCSAFVDTRNSASTYGQTFLRGDTPAGSLGFQTATTTHLADRYVYVIDDAAKRCKPEAASCRAFGKPVFTPNRANVQDFQTVYYKDDITKYEAGLCKPSELFCDEFETRGSKEYFRDPQTHACEYRADVENVPGFAAGTKYSGWFVKGSDATPCYPELLVSGGAFGVSLRGDRDYAGWGATCGQQYAECTEFRDTNNKDRLNPTGKPYYFLKNEKLDTQSCAGQVDPAKGCILMRDTTNQVLSYSTRASYKRYELAGSTNPVAPVNCAQNPSDPNCVGLTGSCTGSLVYCAVGDPTCAAPFSRFTLEQAAALWAGTPLMSLVTCTADTQCTDPTPILAPDGRSYYRRVGSCINRPDDANFIVKAKVDRDCAQWLGCSTSETVIDPATNRYTDVCTNLSLCDEASKSENDIFCAHYVDRTNTSTEPILTRGAFFDTSRYVSRKVGLGEKDYTGYAIPNAFQVPDFQTRRVAVEAGKNATTTANPYKFSLDYRLVAAVPIRFARRAARPMLNGFPIYESDPNPLPHEAQIIPRDSEFGRANVTFNLCRHTATGRIGYFNDEGLISPTAYKTAFCYLPVREAKTSPNAVDDLDFQNVFQKFGLEKPELDKGLTKAYPNAECRAHPEIDSPYPEEFVTNWKTDQYPPKALQKMAGFQGAGTCEFGEDCVCSYKRAEYSGAVQARFYSQLSQNIPPGLCQGGPRDGQSCLPSTIYREPVAADAQTPEGKARAQAVADSNEKFTCGALEGGGRCVPFSRVSLVSGVFGYCLQRDVTRTLGTDMSNNPCLTFNPSAIFIGPKDPYHYHPKSGYFPPENSGQYYCLSDARPPRTYTLQANSFAKIQTRYAGAMTKIDFDQHYLRRDAICVDCRYNQPGAAIDSYALPAGSNGADEQCFYASHKQVGSDQSEIDPSAIRLVGTGRYLDKSYIETFLRINPESFVSLYDGSGLDAADPADGATRDQTISHFSIQPIAPVTNAGRIGCGYQADWVDGMSEVDYNNTESLSQADTQWREKFRAEFSGVLARGNETLMKKPNGQPYIIPCTSNSTRGCYIKTWEMGYRSKDQAQAFKQVYTGADPGAGTLDTRIATLAGVGGNAKGFVSLQDEPRGGTCESDKSWFAVRAVFETPVDVQGVPTAAIDADPGKIVGPWNFTGFWTSTCGGKVSDYRYIYMKITAHAYSICKELAEVRSKDSRQDAAFTDRVWKDANFTMPGIGTQYGSRFAPFASALNTKPAGKEPLFLGASSEEGGRVSGPEQVFLGSPAATYYRVGAPDTIPKDKWAYLSNVFARIYRVYRYVDVPIRPTDSVCVGGATDPANGRRCNTAAQCTSVQSGTCDTALLTDEVKKTLKYCNSLSGINAGLRCDTADAASDVCHLGALRLLSTTDEGQPRYERLLEPCVLNAPTWSSLPNNRFSKAGGPANISEEDAGWRGAFRCGPNSIRAGEACNSIRADADECPTKVVGTCQKPTITSAGGSASQSRIGRCRVGGAASRLFGAQAVNGDTLDYRFKGGGGVDYPAGTDYVPDSYPPCYENTDCRFDEWSFYMQQDVYYGFQANTTPDATDRGKFWWTENGPERWTKGAIYSVRSSINRENGLTPQGICFDAQTSDAWDPEKRPATGPAGKNVCLYGTPYHREYWTDTSWQAGTGAPEACGLLGCHPLKVFSEQVRGSAVPNPKNAMINGVAQSGPNGDRPGLWKFENNALMYVVRHPNELNRPPGVGEVGIGKKTAANNTLRTDRNSGVPADDFYLNLARCESVYDMEQRLKGVEGLAGGQFSHKAFGVCRGGTVTTPGKVCRTLDSGAPGPNDNLRPWGLRDVRTTYQCGEYGAGMKDTGEPVAQCVQVQLATSLCGENGQLCTGEVGYNVRRDLCQNPNDEYCGLFAANAASGGRAFSAGFPMPTDVTVGHYTPDFMGVPPDPLKTYPWIKYYQPRPPRTAAINPISCASPGQCQVTKLDAISFNGSTEGVVTVAGGQHKSVAQFYAWAAHNQMPLRRMVLDWGDGQKVELPDSKMKNHKPFCGVQKECWDPAKGHSGLTCSTDVDCPPGAGVCKSIGTCQKRSQIYCTQDDDCTVGSGATAQKDTCVIRQFFGNTPDACETNFYEFSHAYSCTGASAMPTRCDEVYNPAPVRRIGAQEGFCFLGPSHDGLIGTVIEGGLACADRGATVADRNAFCVAELRRYAGAGADITGVECVQPVPGVRVTTRCSRDPARLCRNDGECATGDRCIEGLAPPGGCWDQTAQSCRFTPRVLLEDNWGWCTGECRDTIVGGALRDDANATVKHPYGGCYAGQPTQGTSEQYVRDSIALRDNTQITDPNQCQTDSGNRSSNRPWVVYQGSLLLRAR